MAKLLGGIDSGQDWECFECGADEAWQELELSFTRFSIPSIVTEALDSPVNPEQAIKRFHGRVLDVGISLGGFHLRFNDLDYDSIGFIFGIRNGILIWVKTGGFV
ncbi:hypothetical protein N9224_00880 [Akkermansiaceae bacterium]|nr:hypothetical protein [bacterium]MDB4500719.1 hypothetical protein [Akkermansiaceae bacterium]